MTRHTGRLEARRATGPHARLVALVERLESTLVGIEAAPDRRAAMQELGIARRLLGTLACELWHCLDRASAIRKEPEGDGR